MIFSNEATTILTQGAFDLLQQEGKSFVCRIVSNTTITTLKKRPLPEGENFIFDDAHVLLGTPKVNQTKTPVRLVSYKVEGTKYYVATDRFDLTARQVAEVYRLRWNIESFFKWWKSHLKVYHLIARSEYGLMAQMLGGLISYLLMAIYCHEMFNEKVSIKRIRELRSTIFNELLGAGASTDNENVLKEHEKPHAKT